MSESTNPIMRFACWKLRMYQATVEWLDCAAKYGFGRILIRLLMAYEFWTAGMMKYNGTNWFGRFQENFLFPFNIVPPDISWFLATWFELIGAIFILFGLFTRFWAFTLIILSIVAISAVHMPAEWPGIANIWDSYRISKVDGSGNFRVPLLFIAMLSALVFTGAGKLSLDHWFEKRFFKHA